MKKKEKSTNPKEHWLEYAEPKYGKKLVLETKILLNILVLYIPLPVFWALFDQQGSRWTFQATRMNGDIGFYTIKPDQMQVINPLLILAFIPLYEAIFYPLLSLLGVRRPLQKLTLGGIFAGVAFLCSMVVEILIEPTYAVLPKVGESQFRIYNGKYCDYQISTSILVESLQSFSLPKNNFYSEIYVPIKDGDSLDFTFALRSTPECDVQSLFDGTLRSMEANSFFIFGTGASTTILPFEDNPDKSRQGTPKIRVLANLIEKKDIFIEDKKDNHYTINNTFIGQFDIAAGEYTVKVNTDVVRTNIVMKHGGVYTIIINEKSSNSYVNI
jgi:solute carrier family 15 oligopeptide transporter 1